MLLSVTLPHEPFNTLVREKKAAALLGRALDQIKPEAAYFTEEDGHRKAILVVEVADPSKVPSLAEPFFLTFNADCRFRIVMNTEELKRSGLDDIASKWG
jgi:hypothetical protein